MARIITQQDIDIIRQNQKSIYIKINLLNSDRKVIDSLEGVAISASIQIDANSAIRRTASFSFYVKNKEYITSSYAKIWIDKVVELYVGYLHQRTKEIIWYKLGVFVFDTNSFTLNATTKTVSCSCKDLMSFLNGDRSGKINATEIVIPVGSDIRDATISLLTQAGGITQYIVEDIGKEVPYDLKFQNGATVYEVIDKMITLYPGWEMFFDEDGVFINQAIPSCEHDQNIVDASFFDGLIIDEKCDFNLNDVKNVITVWGKDGLNSTWKDLNPDSPFYVERIGEYSDVLSGGEYDNIYDQDLCDQRAAYEGWLHTRLNDSITVLMIAVPWFPVNRKFEYKSLMTGETNEYISKSISMDLLTGQMSLTMSRFYLTYPDIINLDFISHLY